MPGLNEIISSSATATRGWSAYNTLKQKFTGQVTPLARVAGLGAIGPGFFTYLFIEPDRKRDPSNVVGGGVKLIEDALQASGLLPNDGWAHVLGYTAFWRVGKPGCLVHWSPTETQTKDAMEALLEKELNGNPINGRGATGNEPHRAPAAKATRRLAKPRGPLGRNS